MLQRAVLSVRRVCAAYAAFVAIVLLFQQPALVRAQCGPHGDRPYPPGETECPPPSATTTTTNDDTGLTWIAPRPPAVGGWPVCSEEDRPCPIPNRGTVAQTIVNATNGHLAGAHIYGPFEDGFGQVRAVGGRVWTGV